MPSIYQFLGTHEVLIYILLSIGALFGLRWLWRSWNEWRHAVYSLEKEFALRRIGQSMASLALILVLFFRGVRRCVVRLSEPSSQHVRAHSHTGSVRDAHWNHLCGVGDGHCADAAAAGGGRGNGGLSWPIGSS